MELAFDSLAFAASLLGAFVMGFAIQRGATCTVAAVDDLVTRRCPARLAALMEGALWVAGGLLLLRAFGFSMLPSGYALSGRTVGGAALLGFGAWVNRACVFGALARFGSGHWAQAWMPLGFFAGCLTFPHAFARTAPPELAAPSPVFDVPPAIALLLALVLAWRLARPVFAAVPAGESRWRRLGQGIWTPHAATTVIAVAFLVTLVLAGAWAYTDLLADLAAGRMARLAVRGALVAALLAGAVWGGWRSGQRRGVPVTAADSIRSLAGGWLMGWGTLAIPGSNDSLILVGMPLMWGYAWVAFLTMCAVIAAAIVVSRFRRTASSPAGN